MTTDRAVVEDVRDRLARGGHSLSPETVARALRERGLPVGDRLVLGVHDSLVREVRGAGILEPLLRLPDVTDVLVNGPTEVWIDRGRGLERQEIGFDDDEAVRRLAQRLAATAGRRLDDATPYVDARLPDGSRLHAVLAPLARSGTSISVRVPRRRSFTLDELAECGFVDAAGADLLNQLVRSRRAFVISGGTGAGKSALLDALLAHIDPAERVVLIEDSAELNPAHPHLVCLEARPANVEGVGAIPMAVLVRQAMRMRPDRIVVGEVRGAEVVDLLAAMNTGHDGGACTIHANSAQDLPVRFEALALAAGLDRDATHAQVAAAIDVVLHVVREGGRRRLAEVGMTALDGDRLHVDLAVRFRTDGRHLPGPAAERLAAVLE